MRLFINGEKVFEGKPEKFNLRIEAEGEEKFGPSILDIVGGGLTFIGTNTEPAFTVIVDPSLPVYGLMFLGGPNGIDNSFVTEHMPEPEYINR